MVNGLARALGGIGLGGGFGAAGGGAPTTQGATGLINAPPAGTNAFPRTLRADDFNSVTIAVSATEFSRLGKFTVPAQQAAQFGQGSPQEPDNQGYLSIQPTTDASVAITGLVRLSVTNAQETNTFVVMEERTDRLAVNSTDRRLLVPIPARTPIATEDSLLTISMKADTAATWSPTASTFVVPVTLWQ